MAFLSKAGDDFGDMNGIPNQNGVGEKAQAAGLVHNLGNISGSNGFWYSPVWLGVTCPHMCLLYYRYYLMVTTVQYSNSWADMADFLLLAQLPDE
jgi:hypothetical protein